MADELSQKTVEYLEAVREEHAPGTAAYSHTNRALQALRALEGELEED